MAERHVDCLIVGGGPAGLTAAVYLARFHVDVLVLDEGRSRADLIPLSHNLPGFPDGLPGATFLDRLRAQARRYGAAIEKGLVTSVARRGDGFLARAGTGHVAADAVLLATGVVDVKPPIGEADHAEGLARGLLRYCPICDGFEVTDRRVAVLGAGEKGAHEALFLRSYTGDVTLVTPGPEEGPDPQTRTRLAAVGIRLREGPVAAILPEADGMAVVTPEGRSLFDCLYPALGSVPRSGLAAGLGAAVTAEGCVTVDAHQRSSVPGLYAAGDVVPGLDQISHAAGQAAVAATAIRNDRFGRPRVAQVPAAPRSVRPRVRHACAHAAVRPR